LLGDVDIASRALFLPPTPTPTRLALGHRDSAVALRLYQASQRDRRRPCLLPPLLSAAYLTSRCLRYPTC
jgi:hypothetical protein